MVKGRENKTRRLKMRKRKGGKENKKQGGKEAARRTENFKEKRKGSRNGGMEEGKTRDRGKKWKGD